MPPTRDNGMHALRHFYVSVLIDSGESVQAVADYLGHADPGFTLRVYAHLFPVVGGTRPQGGGQSASRVVSEVPLLVRRLMGLFTVVERGV
jgi:hypothetical protein